METLELADEAETRQNSTYREMPGYIVVDGQFGQVDLDGMTFPAKVRTALMMAMADAGHVPPYLQYDDEDPGDDWRAWPPTGLLGEPKLTMDYDRCLVAAVNMVAQRYGWPGDTIGELAP